MGQLRGGTTIAGFTALHSGLKESYLGGNLTINGNITMPTTQIRDNGSGSLIISSNGTGKSIYLRPDGNASTSSQFVINTSGATFGGNKVWHAGNDGSGSGLDADLLDGDNGSYYDHRVYNSKENFLGGGYNGGGSEKPNWFGSGKLKLQMLSSGNIGKGGGSWNDVLWINSYTGSDVKGSYGLVFDKYEDEVGFARQNYDATGWGSYRSLWHTGNFNPALKLNSGAQAVDSDKVDGLHASQFIRSDANDTASGSHTFYGTSTSGGYSSAPIEIKEVGLVGSGQSAINYAPAITWHWGGRVQGQIALQSDSEFYVRDGSTHSSLKILNAGGFKVNGSTVLHTGNYTSTLDGRYMNKTGDTMTGTFWNNGGISGTGSIETQGNLTAGGNALVTQLIASAAAAAVRFTGGGTPYHLEADSTGFNIVQTGVAGGQRLRVKNDGDIEAGNRLYVSKHYRSTVVSITSTGWYNIANNPGNRASARFKLMSTEGGGHQMTEIIASAAYNRQSEADITMLNRGGYSTGEKFGAVRILTAGTYDTMYLQVYIYASSTVQFYMYDNDWTSGWSPMHFTSAGIPSGYTDTKLEFYPGAKRANVITSNNTPHSYGLFPGDVWIQY